ncbi:MAG: hypothetical protein ACRDGG_01115 [Anaerolineae bacterium]
MIVPENWTGATGKFDRVLRTALRQSVRGEEPSARVRESLLRAAAAQRWQAAHQRPSRSKWRSAVRSWVVPSGLWRDLAPPALGGAQALMEILQVQLHRNHWVV